MRSAVNTERSALAVALAALILVAVWAAPLALAVEQTGDLTGIVHDEKGLPLPGSTITLTGSNLQGERSAVTDARGEFSFRALPPGTYELKITAPGYQVIQQEKIVVNVGRTTKLPFNLTAGQLTEKISVTGTAPVVDPVRTTSQDNYTPEYLQQVQVGSGGRDYLSVIANSAGTGPGDGANVTVRGSTLGQNSYLVDGVDTTDPVTNTFGTNFIYDAIQEVQFQTGAFNAEFGRSAGGIINVVTKSGGNEFSGSLDARYRNQNFFESGEHFNPNDLTTERDLFEGTLGGPIVKDKLWFFLAGSYIKSDFAGQGYPASRDYKGHYYLGKLTWQVTPNHKFILQTTGDPATINNVDASPLITKDALSKQTQGSNFFSAQYQGVLSPSLLLQAQVAYYKSKLDVVPQSGDTTTIGYVDFFTGFQSQNAIDNQTSDRFRNQGNVTLTWNKSGWLGDHTFKGGVDGQALKFEFEQFTPGGEYDVVCFPSEGCPGPVTFLEYFATRSAGNLSNKGTVMGYFVQDEWRIHPRLTFNLGLRYGTFSYDNDKGQKIFDARLLQPRFGVSWDSTGDAKNIFKATAGRFDDPSLLALPRVANTRANTTDLFINENFFGDLNGNGIIESRGLFATFGGPGGEIFANHGHLKATNVVEYAVDYERELGPASSVGLSLVRRKTYNIIEDIFDQSEGIYVIDNLSNLVRRYYGAELRYRTQWKKLNLWASYTWAKSRGNIEYTQSLGTDFDFPTLSTNRYGWLSDDTRNNFRLNGFYDFRHNVQLAFAYSYVSGFPWTPQRSTLPYGNEFVKPRGFERLPALHQLDLDLRKIIPIGKTELILVGSVINAFGTEIVTSVNTNVSEKGQAVTWQTPRRYEIGAHFRF